MSVGIQTSDLINSLAGISALKMQTESPLESDASFQEIVNSQLVEHSFSEHLDLHQQMIMTEALPLKEEPKKDSLELTQNSLLKKTEFLKKTKTPLTKEAFIQSETEISSLDKQVSKNDEDSLNLEKNKIPVQKPAELDLPKPFPGNICGIPLTPIVDTPPQVQINFPDQKKQINTPSFQLESPPSEELKSFNFTKEKVEKNSSDIKTSFQKKGFVRIEKTSEPLNFQRPQILDKENLPFQHSEQEDDITVLLKEKESHPAFISIQTKSTAPHSFQTALHSKGSASIDPTAVLTPIRRQLSEAITHDGFSKGETHIKVRLYPEELGTVDIRVDISKDGISKVLFTTENQSVKEILARYSQDVIQIFDQSGLFLDSDGLNFSMRQDHPQNQSQQQIESTSFIEPEIDEDPLINNPFTRSNAVSSGHVDIHV